MGDKDLVIKLIREMHFDNSEIELIKNNLNSMRTLNNFKHTIEERIMLMFFNLNINDERLNFISYKYPSLNSNIRSCNDRDLINYKRHINNPAILKIFCYRLLFSENINGIDNQTINKFITDVFAKVNMYECYNALVAKVLLANGEL